MTDVVTGGLVVVERLHRALALVAPEVLEAALRGVIVTVTLQLRGQDVPPSVVAAPVVAVHLDLDVGLGGWPGPHRPHVQVDVLAGVVPTEVRGLLPGGGARGVDQGHVVRGGAGVRALDVVTDGRTQSELQEVQPHLTHAAAHLGEGVLAGLVSVDSEEVRPARALEVGQVGGDGAATTLESVWTADS